MPAYLIVDLTIHDPERYKAYIQQVPAFIRKHGGEYIVRGGELEVIEGNWKPQRLVVMRFPNRQAIKDFVNDPEYQPLVAVRQQAASTNSIAVDGI